MPERRSSSRLFNASGLLGLLAGYCFAVSLRLAIVVLTVAAALSFGLLAVQYALFTAAITTFVVLMSTTVGEGAFHAAGQRAVGTALGIAIAFLA